ncbi:precorrin-6Y C5,15-methyltransferase (decarboxylating) subunit CbiT [Muricomes intestini]|uniref:precorrin-6Y C5,15-methyltransferase (decarboxylating) subunit CbiT n=1 Tax=Muricomes intestini TaxID=1796634 RepID=UPI002FDB466A
MCKEKRMIYLTGIGMGNERLMTQEAREVFESCDCIIGAERMVQALQAYKKPIFVSYKPEEIYGLIKDHPEYQNVAVALSGDPGFYSGAKKIKEELFDYCVCTVPGISSVIYLAAKLGISWEDAELVSIHGRKQNFIYEIARSKKTFLLFGGLDCAREICDKIHYYGMEDVEFYIGKYLSYEKEEILHKTGAQVRPEDFEGLAAAYVQNSHPEKRVCRHIEDEEFIRGQVPMTKSEVRSVSLSKLVLKNTAVVYDVGAGTGSVSIEAALQSGSIKVYAIEKNPEGTELIRQNCRKFCCDNVEIIEGTAPEAFLPLEVPTHVFIGGSSGNLKEILKAVRKKNPQVRVVLNAISLETVREVMEAIEEKVLREPEIVQIMTSKSRELGRYHMMTGQNPVYIISDGIK